MSDDPEFSAFGWANGFRRAIATGLVYAACFHVWNSIVFTQYETSEEPNVERGIRHKSVEDEATYDDDEDDDEGQSFIPLSWPYLRPGEFYAPKDPEWLEFVKLSKDKAKLQSLRGGLSRLVLKELALTDAEDLADITLKGARQSPGLVRKLGEKLHVFSATLWSNYPLRAPPEYHRLGYVLLYLPVFFMLTNT